MIWVVFDTLVMGTLVIVLSVFVRSGNPLHKIARFWGKSILVGSRIKVYVKGLSNIDPAGPYIYMPNHQSNFDIPVMLGHLPVQFRWLAKMELFKIKKIKSGVSVLIFPEGTRSRDGKIRPFKKGGFVLAIDSGVPIVPVVIKGTFAIMNKSKFRVNPGNVSMIVHKPIDTAAYTRETKEGLMESVRRVMCDGLEANETGEPAC
jgi:1-acyl-sn-glycerol-3-phosphate acyltransferase